MNLDALPQFIDLEQVSDGWIKKYILTYRKPDGSLYTYESASRKTIDEYKKELEDNAAITQAIKRIEHRSADSQNQAKRLNQQNTTDCSIQKVASSTQDSSNSHLNQVNNSACDAVCMVPELPDGSYLMIKEFRYPLNAICIAFPAGLIDKGESLEEAVDRELQEETGYRIRCDVDTPLQALPQPGFSSTGMSDESVQVVFVKVEKMGEAAPEPSELIEPFILPKKEISSFIASNSYLVGTRTQLILEVLAARTDIDC